MTYAARRDWFQIVGLLLLLVAMWFATSCASAPPARPPLPPAEAWPFCALQCAESGQLFIGVVAVDPEGRQFGCGCGQKPAATPQAWRGPT